MIRYVPKRELPRLAYLPGKSARPPALAPPPRFVRDQWRSDETYLFGFDLLNHGYPWEAHEAWESLWRTLDRKCLDAKLLQALIKVAAAEVKRRTGHEESAIRHFESSVRLFLEICRSVAPRTIFLGVDLGKQTASAGLLAEHKKALERPAIALVLSD